MAHYTRSDLQQRPQYGELKDREITDWSPDVSQVNIGQMLQNPSLAPFGFGSGTVMRAYHPSARERLGAFMLGDDQSLAGRNLIGGLIGSTGLGNGWGLLDLTPLGAAFSLNEAIRARDPIGAALAVVPGGNTAGRAAMAGGRGVMRGVEDLEKSALNALTEFGVPKGLGQLYNYLNDPAQRPIKEQDLSR